MGSTTILLIYCYPAFPLSGPSTTTETETVAKYEIMDGAPVKGNIDQWQLGRTAASTG